MPDSIPPEGVLLVEDRMPFVDEVREMLDGSGIEVVHVNTLESEAAHELLLKDWLCILLDLNVPPHTGKATVVRALQLTMNSIVVVTGHGRAEFEAEVIEAGADDYLLKHSVTRVDLIRTIRVASARHLRRLHDNENTRHMQVQMKVLTELAAVVVTLPATLGELERTIAEVHAHTLPQPFFKGFFQRVSNPQGREQMLKQIKGAGWFLGRIFVEIGAIYAIFKTIWEVSPP